MADADIIRFIQSQVKEDVRLGMDLLVGAYGDRIEATVRTVSPGVDHHGLQDINQEVLLRLQQRLREHYRHEGKLWPYIRTVIRGVATDHYRRRRRIDQRMVALAGPSPDDRGAPEPAAPSAERPDELAMRAERIGIVKRALAELDEPCRDIIALHYADDLKYRVIAARLGISVGTVSSRLARCLEKLAAALDGPGITGNKT